MNTRKVIVSMATVIAVAMGSIASTPAAAASLDMPKAKTTTRFAIPIDATPLGYYAEDANGKPIHDAKMRTEITDGKRYIVIESAGVQALACSGWNSPSPTYSWSNHTMHYGMFAQCNEPVQLRARGSLWSGPYPESTNTLQDSLPGGGEWEYGVTTVFIGRVRLCVDWGGFDWWELMMYFEVLRPWGWTQFVPYPAKSLKENECLDIV